MSAVAGGRPVLAAGGIVDGRGLAAALGLGVAGVVMGTRFLLTPEAPITPLYRQQLLAAGPAATIVSGVPDLLWGTDWPGVQARTLRNRLLDRWTNREAALQTALVEAQARLEQAGAAGDPAEMIFLAGMGVGRLSAVQPAGEIVRAVVAEAVAILNELARRATARLIIGRFRASIWSGNSQATVTAPATLASVSRPDGAPVGCASNRPDLPLDPLTNGRGIPADRGQRWIAFTPLQSGDRRLRGSHDPGYGLLREAPGFPEVCQLADKLALGQCGLNQQWELRMLDRVLGDHLVQIVRPIE